MQCGLLGRKLSHSYSPQIHSLLGNYPYALYEVEPDNVEAFLKKSDFTGINVTIPYKKSVIPFCTDLTDIAKELGAVNTIVKRADGSLIGHNTDYFGFHSMLQRSGLDVANKKVLVLGSGGASVTVVAVLASAGAIPIVISRSGENNYENLNKHADASVIVNTTPVGMYPNVEESPVKLDLFPKLEGVLDIIYNPSKTKLLLQAEQRHLITENGLWMLVAQAKESAQWFTGGSISDDVIGDIHHLLKQQMENLILIGMPGSGKSTVGKLLAEKLGKQFVDADTEVVADAGIPIPQIFASYGEDTFRTMETKALSKVCKESGKVIATGGGCVTRKENYPILRQNGTVIWLQRDLSKLAKDGRPLSLSTTPEDMFSVRKPMYTSFADICVNNDHSAEETVCSILNALNWRQI